MRSTRKTDELSDRRDRPDRPGPPRPVSRCVNNEKQIGLAIHNYIAQASALFPPAYNLRQEASRF